MKIVTGLVLCAGCLAASGVAADPLRQLGAAELDAVTAGDVGGAVIAAALANGDFSSTGAHTGAIAIKSEGPAPAIFSTAGASGGSASGVAVGGPAPGVATVVVPTSTAEGKQVHSGTFAWTQGGRYVQISGGASYSVGETSWSW